MFTLVTEKSRFFRVKRGQSAKEIERVLRVPAAEVFGGAIVPSAGEYTVYTATIADNYATVAAKFGADADELKKINGNRPVYPSCRLFIPRGGGGSD